MDSPLRWTISFWRGSNIKHITQHNNTITYSMHKALNHQPTHTSFPQTHCTHTKLARIHTYYYYIIYILLSRYLCCARGWCSSFPVSLSARGLFLYLLHRHGDLDRCGVWLAGPGTATRHTWTSHLASPSDNYRTAAFSSASARYAYPLLSSPASLDIYFGKYLWQ